jgi:hypothetical protein
VSAVRYRVDEHDAANLLPAVSVHVLRFTVFPSSLHNILMCVELM